MTLTVKLVNPERALSQTSPAWYADGSDECAFVGEVALGDRLLDAGDKVTLRNVVHQILSMDPPNGDDYRELLSRL